MLLAVSWTRCNNLYEDKRGGVFLNLSVMRDLELECNLLEAAFYSLGRKFWFPLKNTTP
jgi:hypothetical protein